MFESRLFFVDKLIDMGAKIILCDPHRATGNIFGSIFRVTTFGESHGHSIGGVIDGCPAACAIEYPNKNILVIDLGS